jgi:hypothetical protein
VKPPTVLDVLAAQDEAFVDVHASFTAWPKLMVVACMGAVNATVGMGLPPP